MRRDFDYDFDYENDEDEDVDDPTDPRHPDHDLSTSADYDYDRPADRKPWFLQRWLLIVVGGLLIVSLLLPYVLRFS